MKGASVEKSLERPVLTTSQVFALAELMAPRLAPRDFVSHANVRGPGNRSDYRIASPATGLTEISEDDRAAQRLEAGRGSPPSSIQVRTHLI